MKTLIGTLIFIFLGFQSMAQGTTNTPVKEKQQLMQKSQSSEVYEVTVKKIVSQKNSITVVKEENGIITYDIVNTLIRNELFHNSAKRDEITALPGFFELRLLGEDKPIQVRIDRDYADEYIKKYFTELTKNEVSTN